MKYHVKKSMRVVALAWIVPLLAVTLGGCNAINKKAPPTPTPTPAATAVPATPEPPVALVSPTPFSTPMVSATATARPTLVPGDSVFVRTFSGGAGANASQSLVVVNAANGAQEEALPLGIPAPDWSAFYTTEQQNGATHLRALDPAGTPLRERLIQGSYSLVASGFDGSLAGSGLSPNGQWVVLAGRSDGQQPGGFGRNGGASDRFVVSDTAFKQGVRGAILSGFYRFFAISDDGDWLYLLESVGQDQGSFHWQVRLYDVKKNHLLDQPLVDQTGTPVLIGFRLATTPSADGQWLYTLDTATGGSAALYALNLASHAIVRLALPASGELGSGGFLRASLLAAPDNKTLFAVNGATGALVEIDTAEFSVRRSQTVMLPDALLSPPATPSGPGRGQGQLGGFGGANARRQGFRNTVLSPDGSTLYLPGNNGLAAIDTADLSLRGYYLQGVPVDSLAVSADGARVYVLSSGAGRLYRLNAQNGAILSQAQAPGQGVILLGVATNP